MSGGQEVRYRPIGVIRTPHKNPDATPIQPVFATGIEGTAEVDPAFAEGLQDLDGFSHIYLIYYLYRARPAARLLVRPFLQDVERGVFATRAPSRPNPIGLSVVPLLGREGNILRFDGADMLDGSPLLDIKPYVGRFDCVQPTHSGWQDEVDEQTARTRGSRENRRGATPPER